MYNFLIKFFSLPILRLYTVYRLHIYLWWFVFFTIICFLLHNFCPLKETQGSSLVIPVLYSNNEQSYEAATMTFLLQGKLRKIYGESKTRENYVHNLGFYEKQPLFYVQPFLVVHYFDLFTVGEVTLL